MGNRVLAIDPALRNTGYAVIESVGNEYRALTYGVVKNSPKLTQSGCLVAINTAISDAVKKYEPETCAVESVIYVQSFKTAIVLGAARGAAILAAAQHGLSIYEYPPKRVKQAIVGNGSAQKDQVAFMVRALLGLTETPPHDAADALAIGLTHFYAADRPHTAAAAPKPI